MASNAIDDRASEGAKFQILVVDDNVDSAEAISKLLQSKGHEVRCVFDGASAVTVAEQFGPHLIHMRDGALEGFPIHRDKQFKRLSEDVALFSHHRGPDDLLARLFSQGSLPAADFGVVAEEYFHSRTIMRRMASLSWEAFTGFTRCSLKPASWLLRTSSSVP